MPTSAGPRLVHQVQFYEDDACLHRAIADFFAEGAALDEPPLMIARQRTFEAVAGRLPTGRIQFFDAEETLAAMMNGEGFDAGRCDRVLARILTEAMPGEGQGTIRVFGEMVDLLCARGSHSAAIHLEERWNARLGEYPGVLVLCGYGIERFDSQPDSTSLRSVCGQHSHIFPADDFAHLAHDGRFERAVMLHHHARTSTVYVVDDDESVRRALSRLLSSLRFKVRVFESAEAFLTEADRRLRGCLLLDLQLLGMTGPELQNQLGATRWPLPVIAMSGSHDPQLEAEALRLGARAFLPKPFEADALLDAIAAAHL